MHSLYLSFFSPERCGNIIHICGAALCIFTEAVVLNVSKQQRKGSFIICFFQNKPPRNHNFSLSRFSLLWSLLTAHMGMKKGQHPPLFEIQDEIRKER